MSDQDKIDEDELIECWCGAKGTCEELFDQTGLPSRCGGSGTLDCICGGDFCICHHHGGVECPGCEDCEGDYEDELEEGWDDEDDTA